MSDWSRGELDRRLRGLVVSEATLGNAAWKILAGRVSPDELAEKIERCAWCSYRLSTRGCWHQAALILFEQGLRPLQADDAEVPVPASDQLEIPMR